MLRQGRGAQLELVVRAANAYCEDALRCTEEAAAEAYVTIKKSRARFQRRPPAWVTNKCRECPSGLSRKRERFCLWPERISLPGG